MKKLQIAGHLNKRFLFAKHSPEKIDTLSVSISNIDYPMSSSSHSICNRRDMFKRFSSKVKKAWASVALLSIEMVLIVAIFLLSLLLFAYLIRRVIVLQRTGFDEHVFSMLQPLISESTNNFMLFVTFLGTHKFLIPANLSLIAYFLFIKRHRWYSIKVPAIALSSLGLMFGLKHLFGRQRPEVPLLFEAEGLSFPSGHALFSITFYGLLVYIIFHSVKQKGLRWTLIVFLIILMFVIGFSRVYLRVHYASDVIAGFCVGFMWLVFAIWMLNRMERFSRRQIDPVVQQRQTQP
jgi:undecaprenyl-diphosphatase